MVPTEYKFLKRLYSLLSSVYTPSIPQRGIYLRNMLIDVKSLLFSSGSSFNSHHSKVMYDASCLKCRSMSRLRCCVVMNVNVFERNTMAEDCVRG